MELVTKEMLIRALAINYEELNKIFVQKDGSKVLSSNDFTNAFKAKLEGMHEATISEEEIKSVFNKSGGGE